MNNSLKPKKVLVLGSGPIVIGQAAEFDYAGTQACKALREEGVTTVLVNSNPATIMTDSGIADAVYIEPLTIDVLERVIARERPDGLLPTLGGQTALNLAVELADAGVLMKYGVRLLGTPLETIRTAEDRRAFRELLESIDEPIPPSEVAESIEEVMGIGNKLGLPLAIRPAYTLGGSGGGFATTMNELREMATMGLSASPINQVLIEKSLLGWKEIEYEVIRDGADTCITVCNMENFDPMGVHTGDSIVVAPSQTLSDKEYQMLRSASIRIIRALGIEGGCNIQFALAPHPNVGKLLPGIPPHPMQYYVIEVNPRVSRSSALASKATGYPIARVAAKIAVGKKLEEITNAVTQITTAAFEPVLDYCVIKIPRWPFDKFASGDRRISTQMKATGEVMAIGRSFEAALQKGVRSLEMEDRTLLWEDPTWKSGRDTDKNTIPLHPTDFRLWALMAALRHGVSPSKLIEETFIDPWFISVLERLIDMEKILLNEDLTPQLMWKAKRMGFPDKVIGILANKLTQQVRDLRHGWDIKPVYKMVDTCAAEFEAITPYFYSAYESENEVEPLSQPSALVIGSGPIRIGQGIEFDYCSVHAAWALRSAGVKAIMINSNPETVSTDFDSSDRLYFEPLDEEGVLDVLDSETSTAEDGTTQTMPHAVVQFGGQTAINLSQSLGAKNIPILGATAESIDLAANRERFNSLLNNLRIPQPPGRTVTNLEEGVKVSELLGFPVVVRPSYVLGGRAMEIIDNTSQLINYLGHAVDIGQGHPVLIDKYLEGIEVEVDAVCDGQDVLIPGIMEHIERAGVHSGDSLAIYPAPTIADNEVNAVIEYATQIGKALGIKGLINIQFVIMGPKEYRDAANFDPTVHQDSIVYVLEVNPRSSRTIPFISKITGIPMVKLATNAMLGYSIYDSGYLPGLQPKRAVFGVKAPVFSMAKLPGVDTYLGPEMKSTGEVMGIDTHLRPALTKALLAANLVLPANGSLLITIADRDKASAIPWIKLLHKLGYQLIATSGTAALIRGLGAPVQEINKAGEEAPNTISVVKDGWVDGVVNTVSETAVAIRDGFEIRRAAAERRIPCYTSLDTVRAVIETLAYGETEYQVLTNDAYLATNN